MGTELLFILVAVGVLVFAVIIKLWRIILAIAIIGTIAVGIFMVYGASDVPLSDLGHQMDATP